jgi:hypothetical protein
MSQAKKKAGMPIHADEIGSNVLLHTFIDLILNNFKFTLECAEPKQQSII